MSIQDLQKLSARQMETLKNKQSREMNRMEEGHQNLKAELKKAHEMELVDLQHVNQKHVADESDKKEKVLTQMRHHLDETRRLTDKEIQELKENVSKTTQTEHQKLSIERDRLKSEHDLYLEDMNYRFAKEHKKVVGEAQNQMQDLKSQRQEELANTEAHWGDKINQQTNKFTEKYQTDTKNYKKIKDDQDKQFKNERMGTNLRQQQEMAKLTVNHNQHIEVRDNEFRKGLKEQDLFFEKKYADTLKTRNNELGKLNELNNKVMSKMKSDLQQKLEATVNRADDPFYRFTELQPKLKQFEDRVEISVEIPEHAKSDVNLTIHNKEAIVNFNRRYDDTRTEGNATNKLHKVESFTTRLATNHILDPKSVKNTYADGVMTYVIKKA